MRLSDFWDLCAAHDWYFEMASSNERFQRGLQQRNLLRGCASESLQHERLYAQFSASKFSGPTWGTEKKPLPVRPLTISTFPEPQPAACPGQLSLF